MASCVVCYGPIGERGAWKVAGPGPERLAHFDCHRLAFDRPPAQRCCGPCGRPIDLPGVPTVFVVGRVKPQRYHTHCWLFVAAPSVKADVRVN